MFELTKPPGRKRRKSLFRRTSNSEELSRYCTVKVEAGSWNKKSPVVLCQTQPNAGALSNFEVFDFLQSRGAGKDPTRVASSEFKVYDYLKQCSAKSQTRENISEFLEKSKKYNLAKAESLNIINITSISNVEIDPIVEDVENRMGGSIEELVKLVLQVLPPPPGS